MPRLIILAAAALTAAIAQPPQPAQAQGRLLCAFNETALSVLRARVVYNNGGTITRTDWDRMAVGQRFCHSGGVGDATVEVERLNELFSWRSLCSLGFGTGSGGVIARTGSDLVIRCHRQ